MQRVLLAVMVALGTLGAPGVVQGALAPAPTWEQVATIPRPTGERFRATKIWQAAEPLLWRVAAAVGLRDEARDVWFQIIWNESRGEPGLTGDGGCARGLGQVHAGGLGDEIPANDKRDKVCLQFDDPTQVHLFLQRCFVKCVDNRGALPSELAKLPPSAFLEPQTSALASAYLYKGRGAVADPPGALTRYAGCYEADNTCSRTILGQHKWWRETGLLHRLQYLAQHPPDRGPALALVDRR